jgi:preprotein translocase subunit YajC
MISNAYAQAAAAPGGIEGNLIGMAPIILMFALLYFLMIRPQMKKAKEQKTMVDALAKGDEVIAIGMIGKIVKVAESGYIGVEVSPGNVIHMQRNAVTTLLPKGTYNDVTK